MTGIAFTPAVHTPLLRSSSSSSSSSLLRPNRSSGRRRLTVSASATAKAFTSDPFVLELAESLEDSLPPSPSIPLPLQNLRNSCSHSLLSTRWPSRRDESFRFTDLSFIRQSRILPVAHPSPSLPSPPPHGLFVGHLSALPPSLLPAVSQALALPFPSSDLFWSLNGLGSPDLTVVHVPQSCHVDAPLHLSYSPPPSSPHQMPLFNPRVLLVLEKGAHLDVVEDFSDDGNDAETCYWNNSAFQAVVAEGASLRHSYVQSQSSRSAHTKWTSVCQEASSTYELTEVSTGGKLGRHNLHIQQLGPETVTELSTLHLSVGDQTQDLHSSLVLDHPRGYSRQLHKCIVAHPQGQAVFDGNIKVNRYAQQTDAGQLTRSLLLEPRATVNVKPNLQIVADDVKCSHGAAISDLEESQLLYFRARGIDLKTARRLLIFAFGGEVIDKFPHSSIRDKVRSQIKNLLDPSSN